MAATEPIVHAIAGDGVSLCVFEWEPARRGRAETLLLAHATGFHARCWDRIVGRFPERHVLAVDQRGHGLSPFTGAPHWADFGRDPPALARAFDLQNAIGVGHSMGGHAITEPPHTSPGGSAAWCSSTR